MKKFEFSISREKIREYAELSGDFNPIHLDVESAKQAGFKDVIAHGAMVLAWIVEYLYENFGEKLYSGVSFKIRFVSPLFPDEKVNLRVEERDKNAPQFAIILEKMEGERVAVVDVKLKS